MSILFFNFSLLFVLIEEARALFDNSGEEVIAMRAGCVLVGHENRVGHGVQTGGQGESLVVLMLLNHLGTRVLLRLNSFFLNWVSRGTCLGSVVSFVL